MENNIIKLNDQLSINTKINVIVFDQIVIMQRKWEKNEIGDFQYTLDVIKKMLTPESDPKVIDDMINGEVTSETLENIEKWGLIIQDVMMKFIEAKKKPSESSENIKPQ